MEITVGQQQLEHFGLILGAESRLNKSLKDTRFLKIFLKNLYLLMEFIFSGGTLSKLQELEQWPMSLIQNPENGTMLLFMQVALFILLRMPKSEIWTTSLPLHLLLYHEKNRLDISVFIFWLHGLLLRHFLLQQHTLGPAITRCPRKDFKMGDPPLFVDLHLTQLFEHGQLWQIQ